MTILDDMLHLTSYPIPNTPTQRKYVIGRNVIVFVASHKTSLYYRKTRNRQNSEYKCVKTGTRRFAHEQLEK